jgi:hypothetical protein
LTYVCAEAAQAETTHVACVPYEPRQQYWSVLYLVQGLKQTLPLLRSAGQFVNTELLQALGEMQLLLVTVAPIGLSIAST